MRLQLSKTLLSKKLSGKSLLTGFISLSVLSLFFGADQTLLSASGHTVFEKHQYWRVFTASLLHADLTHFTSNAFFFAGLAVLLHNYFGWRVFPVLSFLAGGLINLLTISFYPPEIHLVGVSGVIYFMAAFWLTLYVLIEKRQKLLTRFIHAIAVSLIFFFPHVFQERVSYLAHALGYVTGVPIALIYYFGFQKKIEAKEEWKEVPTDYDEMEDIIALDESSFHLVKESDSPLSALASDSSQSQRQKDP
jgi:rhomboid protease GluP